jgi:hypothetical protein
VFLHVYSYTSCCFDFAADHQNWFGMDENLGPVAVSIRRERIERQNDPDAANSSSAPPSHAYHYRLLIRTSEVSHILYAELLIAWWLLYIPHVLTFAFCLKGFLRFSKYTTICLSSINWFVFVFRWILNCGPVIVELHAEWMYFWKCILKLIVNTCWRHCLLFSFLFRHGWNYYCFCILCFWETLGVSNGYAYMSTKHLCSYFFFFPQS